MIQHHHVTLSGIIDVMMASVASACSPPTRLCLAGVPAVAGPAQSTPVRWVVGVQASGDQFVTRPRMMVGVSRGREAAGCAVTTDAAVLGDADTERVASKDTWPEAEAVAAAVASLGCCATRLLCLGLTPRAPALGYQLRAATDGADLEGAGHDAPRWLVLMVAEAGIGPAASGL